MQINNRGFWENPTTEGHVYDEELAKLLSFLLIGETVLDLGCGTGAYTKLLRETGIECDGVDGNPYTEDLTEGMCSVVDLSKDYIAPKKYDCVLSLEVGEHIPIEYEDIFLNNITQNCLHKVILSWAVPGQGGDGHVNERPNEYIIEKMEKLGYSYMPDYTNVLRKLASLWWFKNTIMVFRRE